MQREAHRIAQGACGARSSGGNDRMISLPIKARGMNHRRLKKSSPQVWLLMTVIIKYPTLRYKKTERTWSFSLYTRPWVYMWHCLKVCFASSARDWGHTVMKRPCFFPFQFCTIQNNDLVTSREIWIPKVFIWTEGLCNSCFRCGILLWNACDLAPIHHGFLLSLGGWVLVLAQVQVCFFSIRGWFGRVFKNLYLPFHPSCPILQKIRHQFVTSSLTFVFQR